MRPRRHVVSILAALLALAVVAVPATARPRAAKRIAAFDSCRSLIGYAARHVPPPLRRTAEPGPLPVPGRADVPAPAEDGGGEDSSQTNVQEAGVDEPDTVKTDGKTIWAIENGTLHAIGFADRGWAAFRAPPEPPCGKEGPVPLPLPPPIR